MIALVSYIIVVYEARGVMFMDIIIFLFDIFLCYVLWSFLKMSIEDEDAINKERCCGDCCGLGGLNAQEKIR